MYLWFLYNRRKRRVYCCRILRRLSQHFENISQHFQCISQHFENISQHFQCIPQHFKSISQHFQNLSQHFEDNLLTARAITIIFACRLLSGWKWIRNFPLVSKLEGGVTGGNLKITINLFLQLDVSKIVNNISYCHYKVIQLDWN